ncbi:hypothetical protein OUZ56_019714 [Daphnia magna]|uniref:Uncharacterized protein n=1 Tax=Daphnia magna TaxID=35525 RepID=A0ABQ9ZCE9_9CRUS|nr:hypothetical protein OUZ56_019714 [Daphnia magna]
MNLAAYFIWHRVGFNRLYCGRLFLTLVLLVPAILLLETGYLGFSAFISQSHLILSSKVRSEG